MWIPCISRGSRAMKIDLNAIEKTLLILFFSEYVYDVYMQYQRNLIAPANLNEKLH